MSDENQHLDLLTDGLLQIEIELRQLGVWQAEPPPQEAFQSTQP
ncbi:MAG TPA: pseudouridine synthase, partial [Marinobacter sp.]|nr:pseudouridine synthase [Marinobacter sp.]